jgi:hypothetical protein
MIHSRLIAMNDGTVAFESPYDAGLVADLKARVPSHARHWDKDTRQWRIAPQFVQVVADLVQRHLGETIRVPDVVTPVTTCATKTVKLEYLSLPKPRSDGSVIAYGWCDGGWTLVFPLAVLQSWFCVEARPDTAPTLYATLGVSHDVDVAALKSAYRRAARTWHPDVCKEIGAEEQFKLISRAYQVLGDAAQRAKYDAGLMLEASLKHAHVTWHKGPLVEVLEVPSWRPPLRCGWLLCEGTPGVGKFGVSRIIMWEDCINEQGQTLITFWKYGDETFTERWI